MIKAIIFDCFGVLVGTGYWNTFERAGGDLSKDKKFLDDVLYKTSKGEITTKELYVLTAQRLGVTVEVWTKAIQSDEQPNEELFEFIKSTLKPNYKIGFLSNAGRGVVELKLPQEHMNLFDSVVVSAHVGLAKPDPEIYKYAAKELGVAPADCLFVDDNEPYLAGAESVGMKTHLFKSTSSLISKIESLRG